MLPLDFQSLWIILLLLQTFFLSSYDPQRRSLEGRENDPEGIPSLPEEESYFELLMIWWSKRSLLCLFFFWNTFQTVWSETETSTILKKKQSLEKNSWKKPLKKSKVKFKSVVTHPYRYRKTKWCLMNVLHNKIVINCNTLANNISCMFYLSVVVVIITFYSCVSFWIFCLIRPQ